MALYRATVSGVLFGQTIQNVLHFHRADAPQDGSLVLAQSLVNHFYGQVRLQCSNQMTWNLIKIERADAPNELPLLFPTNFAGGWSSSIKVWAPHCCVIQIKTDTPGRTGRGRFYISGLELADVDLGIWTTGRMQQLVSMCTSIKGGYTGPNPSSLYTLGVMPRSGTTLADFKPALDLVPRSIPGTQRRRNIGVGN